VISEGATMNVKTSSTAGNRKRSAVDEALIRLMRAARTTPGSAWIVVVAIIPSYLGRVSYGFKAHG
jgi:hypothetical protein